MKKLVLSTVAAAMMATSASAVTVGLGSDIIGGPYTNAGTGMPVLRVTVDGLVKGLRIEPRFNIQTTNDGAATATKTSNMTFGIGAYYDVVGPVAVGIAYDSVGYKSTTVGTAAAVQSGTSRGNLTVSVKAEKEITKNLSLAYELGLISTTSTVFNATTSDSQLNPYSAVTMRVFF